MIGSNPIFSTADLRDMSANLYGKIKIRGVVTECQCLYDHSEEDGQSDIMLITGEQVTVKTDRIYDLERSEEIPVNWRR